MNATDAYPKEHLKGWKRTVVLDKATNVVLVLDRVDCSEGDKIDLLFHPTTGIETAVHDGRWVSLAGKKARIEMQPLVNAPYELRAEPQYTVRVVKNNPVQNVPCLFTTLKALSDRNVIGTLFYPADMKNADSRFVLDESGRYPVIRYTLGGQDYAYEITEDAVNRL